MNHAEMTRRFLEDVWSSGDAARASDLISSTYADADVWSQIQAAKDGQGGDKALIQQMGRLRAAYPDLNFTVKRVVEDGDSVFTEFSADGKHISRTFTTRNGKEAPEKLLVDGVSLTRFKDGKIQSHSFYWGLFTGQSLTEKLKLD